MARKGGSGPWTQAGGALISRRLVLSPERYELYSAATRRAPDTVSGGCGTGSGAIAQGRGFPRPRRHGPDLPARNGGSGNLTLCRKECYFVAQRSAR
jgi:hypothetical protein